MSHPDGQANGAGVTLALGLQALGKQAEALGREVEGVRTRGDIEHVHRMRVATRRLRTILDLLAPSLGARAIALRQQARRITRALGLARDLDVQIDFLGQELRRSLPAADRAGLRRLRLRLTQRRDEAQAEVERSLTDPVSRGLSEAIRRALEGWQRKAASPWLVFPSFLRALTELLAFQIYVNRPDCIRELHQLRIAAKRLRYTLEPLEPARPAILGPRLGPIRRLQGLLGDIHDCDVWDAMIADFLEQEHARMIAFSGHARGFSRLAGGCQRLRKRLRSRRRRLHRSFVASWSRLQREGFWDKTAAALERLLQQGPAVPVKEGAQ